MVLKLEEFMTKNAITCKETDNVLEVTKLMLAKGLGCLVVINKKHKPIGIITETDILKKVVVHQHDPENMAVTEVMSKNIVTIKTDATLIELSQAMQKHNIRRMPVVKGEKLVGIITARDLIKIMAGI
jgi:CBS domain-containing protein